MIEQIDPATGRLRHLLTLEGLPAEIYQELFARAEGFLDEAGDRVKRNDRLAGRLMVNAFFEPSTRTSLSFEIAARSLGADVVNFDVRNSSARKKDETVADTLGVISHLGADLIVMRHPGNLLDELGDVHSERVRFINGGDGSHAHPSQGLLDVWTVHRELGGVEGLQVAIIGDILHSRVARSTARAFTTLGASVRAVGPPELMPDQAEMERLGMRGCADLEDALRGADIVICLRIQFERIASAVELDSGKFISSYRIDSQRLELAAADALLLHPGPMHRGIEITSEVADGPRSRIFTQVANGVAMRMALMDLLLG